MTFLCRRTLKQPYVLFLTSSISTYASNWNSTIKNASSPQKSLQIYKHMHLKSIPVDTFTVLYTLTASTHLHSLGILRHLHAHILRVGFTSNVYIMSSLLHGYSQDCFNDARVLFDEMPDRTSVTWNTMITGFSRSGNVEKARSLFDEMPTRNIGSWSAMISAYVKNCHHRNKGLELFYRMLIDEKLKPDEYTLCAILAVCGSMGTVGLMLGKFIHGFIIRNDWDLNVELGTTLVDMYAKCGFLKIAMVVFGMMPETNVVSWTALICGAAQHGYSSEARSLFEKMQKMGVKPNEFTFTGVLSACVQAGLVEEGRGYFNMIEKSGLKPKVHHYCCMVDLFGKAGNLEDAYEIIMRMEQEVHGKFPMAERVINRVIEILRPEKDGGVYILIADLFVMGEKFDDAERMRKLFVTQNVKKARGTSSC